MPGSNRMVRLQRSITSSPEPPRLLDQEPEARIQLGRAAGEVDDVDLGARASSSIRRSATSAP